MRVKRTSSPSKALNTPPVELDSIYPNCHYTKRIVNVGGRSKLQLVEKLKGLGIEFNEAAETLLSSDRFTTSETRHTVVAVELSVRNLGYRQGATIAEIYDKATALGLYLLPIELGPHLRLQYLDQPEGFWGHPSTVHRAPPGSIMIASSQLSEDDEFPKGLYLRRIKGKLWLRGYRSGPEHIYDPDDHFIFGGS